MPSRILKLQSFLASNPDDSFLKHALALEYVKEGNDVEARKLFETVLNADPQYIGSYYHLGKLLERTEDYQAAIEWYKKGLDISRTAGDMHAYNELYAAIHGLTD
jgi:tetratricopeptide (TPR) repeat protein